jgi:hypothetical protein
MRRQKVIKQVLPFLEAGKFSGYKAQQFDCPAQKSPEAETI